MRMGGFSSLRRRSADGHPTHALFADQCHSIRYNAMALFGHSQHEIAQLKPRDLR
jgi:hypothetical protein